MVVFASVSNETNECVYVPAGDCLSPDPEGRALQDRGLRRVNVPFAQRTTSTWECGSCRRPRWIGGTITVTTASSQAVPCGSPLQRKVHWSRKLRPLQVQLSSERALFHTARGLGNYLWQWLAWQPRERLIWTRNNCVCFIKSNSSPCPCVMAL